MEEFTFETVDIGTGKLQFNLKGYLDERADLPDLTHFADASELTFNFSECQMINSMGIKKWVVLMDKVQEAGKAKVILSHCPIMVVNQVNLIKGFLPKGGEVDSIYFPIVCTKCDEDFSILGQVNDIKDDSNKIIDGIKELDCDKFPGCKRYLEIDFAPEFIFGFLKNR